MFLLYAAAVFSAVGQLAFRFHVAMREFQMWKELVYVSVGGMH